MLMLSEANTQKREQHHIIQEYKAIKQKMQEESMLMHQSERLGFILCKKCRQNFQDDQEEECKSTVIELK